MFYPEPRKARLRAPGSSNFDTQQQDYDSLGRPSRSTLAFNGTLGQTSSSANAITTTYDALGRPLTVTDAGGGTVSYSYTQNDLLVTIGPAPTGESTKRRQLEYDGFGRLASVCELTTATGSGTCAQNTSQTGFWTKYTYDLNNNLLSVTQNAQAAAGSQQTRNFVYDFLSRMTSETNPENGTTTYTYDSASGCTGTYNADLVKKVDAVGNVTCLTYDAMHRVLSKTYPSGSYASVTPGKYFVYDSATVNSVAMTNAKGRLAEAYTCTACPDTKLTDIGYSYTNRGEISDVYESAPHSSGYYHLTQSYWPHGAPNVLNGLPGLPTITYGGTIGSTVGIDGQGRFTQITASTGANPVTAVTYSPYTSPPQTSVTFGSNDSDNFQFDAQTGRIAQYKFNVGTTQSLTGALTWNANNTLKQLTITDPFNSGDTQTCNYGYDDLTRLTGANCGSTWSGTYTFDSFGNLAKSGSMSFAASYSNSTNRMSLVGTFTPTYDANGNVLNDGAHTYAWDADGNSITIDGVGIAYDALNRAIEQNRSGSYTEIAYSPTGDKLALMNGQSLVKAFVPLSGGATAVYTSSGLDHYRHSDWLGSNRLSSTPSRTVQWSGAYAPWGELYASSPSGSADPSFTGENSDTSSTGEYDFLYRQYGTQGRWPTPDPSGLAAVNPSNPQSWNRYAYVLNNPLAAIDPNGLDCVWVAFDSDRVISVQNGDGDCSDHDGLVGYYIEGSVDKSTLGFTDNGDVFGDLLNGTPFCSGSCDVNTTVSVSDTPIGSIRAAFGEAWLEQKVYTQAFFQNYFSMYNPNKPNGCLAVFQEAVEHPKELVRETAEALEAVSPAFLQTSLTSGRLAETLRVGSLIRGGFGPTVEPTLGPLVAAGLKILSSKAAELGMAAEHIATKALPAATLVAVDVALFYGVAKESKAALTGDCHP